MMRKKSFSRRAKKPVRWFASNAAYVSPNTSFTLASGSGIGATAKLAEHVRSINLPGDLSFAERHTVMAVRGTIIVNGGAEAPVNLSMGIIVREIDATGAVASVLPNSDPDAAEGWLWLWHGQIRQYVAGVNGIYCEPSNIQVNIKTKRVLRDNQALVLVMYADRPFINALQQVASNCTIYPYLRTLISRSA